MHSSPPDAAAGSRSPATIAKAPTTATHPTGALRRTATLRRTAAGLALLAAPWGFVVANGGYAWATRHGGNDETGADALALVAGHTGLFRAVLVAGILGCLLLVPALLAGMRLTRARSPWLSLIGGAMMIAGYVCYLGILASNFTTIAMVDEGGPVDVFAKVIDQSEGDPGGLPLFLLFVLGNLVGTALFGTALLRSRVVPAWAAVAVLTWPVLHITGLIAGTEWFAVAGAVLQACGFAALGLVVLRRSNEQWDA